MTKDAPVQIDIPCDIQQVDTTGYVWTFLDEARDPALVSAGAIVIAADETDPVIARVEDLVPAGARTIVTLRSSRATRPSTPRPCLARTS